VSRARARVGPQSTTGGGTLDVDRLLDDPHTGIIVCCGSGGVGKTTVSAALALRAAERGRRVVVLTIDPARRLAQSMGIEVLDNTPRPVSGVGSTGSTGAETGAETGEGRLDAMMLDMKRTFDEVVESQASPEKALDFLDAPERLSSFLDGRFIRLLLAPAKGPARLMSAGFGLVTNALNRILGTQVLRDMQTFVAAFDTLFGGFRQRAQKTFELLQADGTAFLVVAAPEPDALREAAYFVERLSEDDMPLAGLVVNRASPEPLGDVSAEQASAAAQRLRRDDPDSLTAGLLRLHADRVQMVEREARLRRRFEAAHPQVPMAVVPALAGDVHDLAGLRQVGALLAGERPT